MLTANGVNYTRVAVCRCLPLRAPSGAIFGRERNDGRTQPSRFSCGVPA